MKHSVRVIVVAVWLALTAFSGAAQESEECPETQFGDYGMYGVVTPGDANNLRDQPARSGALIGKVEPGVPFDVYGVQPVCADGFLWIEINTLTQHGWTVEIAADGGEPYVVPYEQPEPREVGMLQEDGSILIEDSGVSFTVPAGLGIETVTVRPDLGFFGESMSSQPSSVVFELWPEDLDDDEFPGRIEIFPHDALPDVYDYYWKDNVLAVLLDGHPDFAAYLTERGTMPIFPYGGAAALFNGVPAYLQLANGEGVRYVTLFAQDAVLFEDWMPYQYEFRGLSTDRDFLIAGRFPVNIPAAAIPAPVDRYGDQYVGYLHALEANLADQPTNAFTPDLTVWDSLLASLTITDNAALLSAIP